MTDTDRQSERDDMSKVELVAEALWQAESMRASGRKRRVPWSECGLKEVAKYMHLADAAIAALKEDQS